ncbi:unnamed protein product [Lota lota]
MHSTVILSAPGPDPRFSRELAGHQPWDRGVIPLDQMNRASGVGGAAVSRGDPAGPDEPGLRRRSDATDRVNLEQDTSGE